MTIFYEPRWSRVQFLVFNRMKSFSHQSSGTGNIVYVMSHIQWWRNQVKTAYQIFSDYFLWCVDLRWEWSAQSPHDRGPGFDSKKEAFSEKSSFLKSMKKLDHHFWKNRRRKAKSLSTTTTTTTTSLFHVFCSESNVEVDVSDDEDDDVCVENNWSHPGSNKI